MIIRALAVGPMMSNCFILGCDRTKEAVVIDPGDDVDRILHMLAESKLKVKYIVNTHGHFDHVGGNKRQKDVTGAELLIHAGDAPMLEGAASSAASMGMRTEASPAPDRLLEDGDTLTVGDITLTVIHTAGHSAGGICLHTDGILFAGDTLFAGSIGRTDFPGGNHELLLSNIREKLYPLGDDIRVFTGHGPETTIGRERRFNPFVNDL
ncbi:MAG: MBL fold metallo-hydrolase [Desulfobacterales bacterium]